MKPREDFARALSHFNAVWSRVQSARDVKSPGPARRENPAEPPLMPRRRCRKSCRR